MRLKSIKLAGFKSFVDPTTVQFPHNMSAVVGPNGCGKSNIIDAVRWVMGESSAKNLRGESMTDVIFNGSGGRQPVGQASIELVFDNSDGTLGGEYARFSEIAIRRLVTRAGQSDYFLNGTKCRRRDITDIFLGTGLGPRSYAIIEQGMISRLIESKPEELRVFIEEAAGISKYKERRRETENRMRRTLENLERLQDIRDELSRQIYHLERQAQAAEKYKEFRSREREAKAQVAAMQWRDLSIQVESLAYSINDLETQREGVIAEYRALEAQLEQTRLAYSDSTEKCNQIQAEYYSIGAEVTRFEQAIQFQQQRQGQLQQRLAQTEASLGLASESLRGDELALGHAREALDVLLPEKEEVEARAQQASDSLNDAEIAMQDWQQHWDGFNQRAAVARQQSEVQQSRIKHLEQVLSRLARRTEQLSSELASLSEIGQAEASEDYAERLEILESQRSELEAQRLSTSEQRDTLRVQLAEARRELSETQTKLQQVGGRLSALESLQERDQSNSGDTLLQWIEQAGLSDLSPLVETLSVDANWRIAAERVLGDDLHGLLSKSADLPAHALDAFSAARFYLQGQTCREKREGTLASAVQSEWVPSYFNSIRTVDSIDEAQKARSSLEAGESLITPEGVWFGPDWIRLSQPMEQGDSALYRQEQIDSLRTERIALGVAVNELEERCNRFESAISEQESVSEVARVRVQEVMSEQSAVNAEMSAALARFATERERRAQIEAELADSRAEYEQEEAAIGQARRELTDAIESMEVDANERERLIALRESHREKLDTLRQAARDARDQSYQLNLREQQCLAQIAATEQAIERLQQQYQELQNQREQIIEELATSDDSALDTLRAQLDEQLNHRLVVEERLSEARDALSAIETEMRTADQKRLAIEQRRDAFNQQLEQQRLQKQTMFVQQQTLVERLKEDDWTVDTALETVTDDISLNGLQAELDELARKITRLGAINLAAIDEFRSQSERKQYLDSQHEDLTSALETLEAAIRKIDKETRSRFRDTFEEVNAGLQELFPRVFGGGSAHLEMTGDDLLDTGIAIMARPPGKKNSTIHLLSGGEKALTAIALVFSIFQLNPAPFCMLDEVDAPLDDANVGRYARMVKEMSEKVQFIYITHNKISMEVADQLLGVTMHEPGVSRLVSVDVEEAAELAAS